MDELKEATLAVCRRDMLKMAMRSGVTRSKAAHELDLRIEAGRRVLRSIGTLNRTSNILRKIRDGLRELAQLQHLDKPAGTNSDRLAAQINRSVGPALLAKLDHVPLLKFVKGSELLMFVDTYERMGWTDPRAIACMALLAGYWPNLAGRKLNALPVAEVIQTVREAVKFQWQKVQRMRTADANHVSPKFRIIGTK